MPEVCVDATWCQLDDKFRIWCFFYVFYPTPAWKEIVVEREPEDTDDRYCGTIPK